MRLAAQGLRARSADPHLDVWPNGSAITISKQMLRRQIIYRDLVQILRVAAQHDNVFNTMTSKGTLLMLAHGIGCKY
jgi:hypothetical protein